MYIPERSEQLKKGLYELIDYINDHYGNTKEMTIMEIGSWTGVSAEIFAQYFKHVICVDPWAPTIGINTDYDMGVVEQKFHDRIEPYDNITPYKATSVKARTERIMSIGNDKFPDGYDVIYVDGAHDYKNVKQDILLWKDLCKVLCGHDYWKGRFDGVIKAVHETVGMPEKVFSDTSWIKGMR